VLVASRVTWGRHNERAYLNEIEKHLLESEVEDLNRALSWVNDVVSENRNPSVIRLLKISQSALKKAIQVIENKSKGVVYEPAGIHGTD